MSAKKWYIIQTYSGSEKSVVKNIDERVKKRGMSDLIFQIVIPFKKKIQIKKGKKVEVEQNLFPGYILIEANLTDELWVLIRDLAKVSGFVSQSGKPCPVSQKEVDDIISRVADNSVDLSDEIEFEVGESIKVIDGGPFDGFMGVVESVSLDKKEVSVLVSIFGRETPVNLTYNQVEKI